MRRAALTFSIFIVILASVGAHAQTASRRELFRAPREIPAGVTAPHAPYILRSRLTDLALETFERRLATRGVKTPAPIELSLDLFGDERLEALIESVTAGAGESQIFEGRIAGDAESYLILTVSRGEVFGNVRTRDRWYQIRPAGQGLHAVVEMDAAALGSCVEPVAEPIAASMTVAAEGSVTAAADDGSMIDVLVMYTPKVRAAAGGTTAIENLIDTAEAETNTAYQKSAVTQRMRVVHTAETVNWVENGSSLNADSDGFTFNDALSMIRSTTDGKMDETHALRNQYGADAVVLLVDIGGSCGVAYIGSTASNAFAVVQYSCATGNFSFGHELGHNMGLKHERTTTGTDYAYGWADPDGTFRTIMATKCGSYSCGRIQQFSNPDILYKGLPTGSPLDSPSPAHSALTLNEGAVAFSNFRTSVLPACTYSLSAMSVSVSAIASVGTVNVTAGSNCSWAATSKASFLTVTAGSSGSGNGVVSYSVAANSGTARSGVIEIAGHNFTVNQSAGTALAAPTGVRADSLGSTIRVSWQQVTGAASYTIQRRAAGGSFADVMTTSALSWDDVPPAGAAYLYRLRANATGIASPFSAADLATTVAFTDDPLSTGVIKAAHLSELRTAVNKVRVLAGLPALSFTDIVEPGLSVRSVHVTELRSALDAALGALALPVVPYGTSAATGQLVRAADFQELRERAK